MLFVLKNYSYKPMLYFLCCIIFRNRPIFYFVVFCYICVRMAERGFYLNSVPREVMKYILLQAGFDNSIDLDSCIIVPSKHLLEPFNTNKIPCWVQLCLQQNSMKRQNQNVRLVLAVGLPGANGATIIASDVLCHNIKKNILPRGALRFSERPRIVFHIVKDSPKFAESIELSPVRESFGQQKDAFMIQTLMSSYFKTPRYVQSGDILCAPGPNKTAIHLAVVRVQGNSIAPGFLIQAERTKIEQGPDVTLYVPTYPVCLRPVKSIQTITATNFKEFLIDKCPPWLHGHALRLAGSLLPFLPAVDGLELMQPSVHHLPVILISGPQGSGKQTIIKAAVESAGVWDVGGLHICSHDCSALRGTGPGSIEKTLSSLSASLSSSSLCLVAIHNIEWLALGRDGPDEGRGVESWMKWIRDVKRHCRGVVAVMATTRLERANLPAALARSFIEEISLHEAPDLAGRESILRWMLHYVGATHADGIPKRLAQRTAGFIFGDIVALISRTLRKKYIQVRQSWKENEDILLEEVDFEETLDQMHAAYSDAIGAPKIPSVSWDDVGGLSDIREEILTTIELPIKHPELLLAGLKRTGILLYGPPGTGKTLLAKAVATECSFNFISVKGPELLNMYVGQSEANVREVFQRARSAAPCIIFFDELDSLAPNRGRTGDSGGVMDRVVSQLLAEMDGQYKVNNIFIMGATNRPDLVDPALLRPGRFDKILYVGPYEDRKSQLSVMNALTRKFSLAAEVSLESIVALFPEQMSGADMQAVCSGAMVSAIRRGVAGAKLMQEGSKNSESMQLQVGMEDFHQSLSEITPSISHDDLFHFKKLRLQFEKSVNP